MVDRLSAELAPPVESVPDNDDGRRVLGELLREPRGFLVMVTLTQELVDLPEAGS
jgi:hypothetical protein